MRPPKLRDMTPIVLLELYRGLNFDSAYRMRPSDLAGNISRGAATLVIGEAFVARALQALVRDDLAETMNTSNGTWFEITDAGIAEVERLLESEHPVLVRYEQQGIEPFFWGGTTTALSTEDDRWSPLEISREANDYQLTLGAVEAVIAEVGKSNGYAAEFPDERDAILTQLTLGLEAIKQTKIAGAAIQALLIRPLKFLVGRFPDAAIGLAADKALEWVLRITGLN